MSLNDCDCVRVSVFEDWFDYECICLLSVCECVRVSVTLAGIPTAEC